MSNIQNQVYCRRGASEGSAVFGTRPASAWSNLKNWRVVRYFISPCVSAEGAEILI